MSVKNVFLLKIDISVFDIVCKIVNTFLCRNFNGSQVVKLLLSTLIQKQVAVFTESKHYL